MMPFNKTTLKEIIARMDADASRLVLSDRPVAPVSFVGGSIRIFAVLALICFLLVILVRVVMPYIVRRTVRRLSIKVFHFADLALHQTVAAMVFVLVWIYSVLQRVAQQLLLPEWMRGDPDRPESMPPTGATTAAMDGAAAGGIKSNVGSSNADGDGLVFHSPAR